MWATSKHDVYLMQNYSVMHWSSLIRRGKEVLNVARPIVPALVSRDIFITVLLSPHLLDKILQSKAFLTWLKHSAETPWLNGTDTLSSANKHHGC